MVRSRRPKATDKDVISRCQKNMGMWYSYFSENLEQYRVNRRFYYGDQWLPEILANYQQLKKPALVFNHIKQFVTKLVGEQRNAGYTPIPIPKTADANPDSVKLVEGLTRAIFNASDSREAFAATYINQLVGGYGVLRLGKRYESSQTFDQCLCLENIIDPLSTFFDPLAKKKTKIDGNFAGCYQLMNKEDFETQYPNATFTRSTMLPDNAPKLLEWGDDTTAIVEYYERSYRSATLVLLTNNETFKKEVYQQDVIATTEEYYASMLANGIPPDEIPPLVEARTRATQIDTITCYKLTSLQILEETVWPTDNLPLFFVDGDSLQIEGKQRLQSLVELAKDPQRFLNYVTSEIAYGIKSSRRETFMATPRQIKGFEKQWRQPENVRGVLEYNADPQAGGSPQRLMPHELPQTLFMAMQASQENISKTMGLLDPITGGLPNAASGVAINRTINQQNLVVVNYVQNLYNSLTDLGKEMLKLIPDVYDTERVISIMGPDDELHQVMVNSVDAYNNPINELINLNEVVKDFRVETGASFASEKQMSLEFLMQLFSNPEVAPLIADLIPDELDLSIAPALKQRLKTMVPPAVLAAAEGEPMPPQPPQPNPALMELQLKQQMAQDKVQMNAEQLAVKREDIAVDAQKALLNAQTELLKTHMESTAEMNRARDKLEALFDKMKGE